jgi:predicted S18 family serine protease
MNLNIILLINIMLRNAIVAVALLSLLIGISGAYTVSIHAPAVLENEYKGTLTTITLNITPGTGIVTVNNDTNVGLDTIQSAMAASTYAAKYLGVNQTSYNYNYTIGTVGANVSGPSAGLAMTLLTISGIDHRPLLKNFTVTGTIVSDGSVGEIGGVYDKVGSANASKLSFVMVPYAPDDTLEYLLYYISQQHYHIPLVMVKNVSQAIPYAFNTNSNINWLVYNITQNYNAGLISNANITCNSCNTSSFNPLVNYTFNVTMNEINQINSSRYGNVKSQMYGLLDQYENIASKGYLYLGADLAFLEYQQAFVFANADNYNTANASTVLDNAYAYCSSLLVPQITDTNYEYVTGGMLRQSWANITISNAKTELNDSESTDEIISALYTVAPAYGWCQGARAMYTAATSLGGNPITFSSKVGGLASSLYNGTSSFPNNIYTSSLIYNYRQGNYGVALYASAYEKVFGQPSSANISFAAQQRVVSDYIASASNTTFGIWSQQFAAEAEFYLNEAAISKNNTAKDDYIGEAYSVVQLSSSIGNATKELSSSIVYNTSVSSTATQLDVLQQELTPLWQADQKIEQLIVYLYVLFIILALFVILSMVLVMRTVNREIKSKSSKGRRGRNGT